MRFITCVTKVRLSPSLTQTTNLNETLTILSLSVSVERGVVWEETIILLPHKVHYVFLSATIPNAMEFAEWICTTHQQPCHVVYTDYRPTPLQHYLFPAGADGIHLVVDEKGNFREDNFAKAMGALGGESKGEDPASALSGKGRKGKTKKGGQKGESKKISAFFEVILILERVIMGGIRSFGYLQDCQDDHGQELQPSYRLCVLETRM